MSHYGVFERRIARALDAFPRVRSAAKTAYKRLNYWRHREPGFEVALHPDVEMRTAAAWAGAEEQHVAPHFFGYYDKTPWSPDGRYLLSHRICEDGAAEVQVCDRSAGEVRTVGRTRAWNHQQGSMAQWLPGADVPTVVFNAIEGGVLGARIVPVASSSGRFVPWPVQVLRPDGAEALSLNYKRLSRTRAEYGYATPVQNFSSDQVLERDGLWRVDLASGEAELIVRLSDLKANDPRPEMEGATHRVNHAMYAPGGTRFVFMHRWLGAVGAFSRLYVAAADGSGRRLLFDSRMVSHYCWRDEEHLLAWARTEEKGDRYYLVDVTSGTRCTVGEGALDAFGDGHPSYAPDRRWIVTDTYPDKARQRHLLLYGTHRQTLVTVGRFLAPLPFEGPDRCDLHPRWSRDGNYLSIDSAHEGARRSYVLDVRALVAQDGRPQTADRGAHGANAGSTR